MNEPQLTPEDIENLDDFRLATMWQDFASSALSGAFANKMLVEQALELAEGDNIRQGELLVRMAAKAADTMLEEAKKRGYAELAEGAESVEPWPEDDELRRAVEGE